MKTEAKYDIGKVLREMREEYWRGIEEVGEAVAETIDYLIFRLAGERFGLPTVVAREVLRLPKLVRVPRVPDAILGVINLRGEGGRSPTCGHCSAWPGELPPSARLLVVEGSGLTTALLAEQVEGIRRSPAPPSSR